MKSPLYSITLAVRSLARARGMTIVAALTLGIGLSAAVALLGVVDGGVRALPVPHGEDIVELEVRDAHAKKIDPPAPVTDWASGRGVLDAGAFVQMEATLATAEAPAVRAVGAAMQPSVFSLLQIPPALGRVFSADPSDAPTIVLGWDTYVALGGTPSLLGRMVTVDGAAHTVVGVMPRGFGFPEKQSFWTVLPSGATGEVVARLAHGSVYDDIAASTAARINALPAVSAAGVARSQAHVLVQPWTRSRDSGGEGAIFGALGVLVALLLVVCASNVATLLLVRANERAASLAIHSALGATRRDVAYQLLLEALLIALAGGAVGLAGGYGMLHWMQSHLAAHWGYYWMRMEVRLPVVFAMFFVVLLTALVAGIAPAWRASRVNLSSVLVGAGRGRYDVKQRHLGRVFVAVQVGFSTIGLIAAAYLAWGATQFGRITSLLPMDNLAVGSIALDSTRYASAASRLALASAFRTELHRLPGVRSVSVTSAIPGGGAGVGAALLLPGQDTVGSKPARVGWLGLDANALATYSLKLVAGRFFDASDGGALHRVAVVTPSFVRRHLTGAPVGQRIHLDGVHGDGEYAEIIGVATDWFPENAGRRDATDRVFVPLADVPSARTLYVSVRTTGDASRVTSGIRAAVSRTDHSLAVDELQTLRARMDWFLRMTRVIAAFGVLGGIGSALVAAIGLYGVMSFQVRAQIREIGVRMAIGASRTRILTDVLRESSLRVAPGLLFGMALGVLAVPGLSRFAGGGAPPPSALVLSVVAFAMLLIGVAAALEPALRASRLSPQVVLRQD